MTDALEAEIAALQRRLAIDRFAAVEGLRAAHEAAARAWLGATDAEGVATVTRRVVEGGIDAARAARAAQHLADAERWQWEIGTWSTGSGEGLASMAQVRELQLAQAWLLAAVGEADTRSRALALLAEVDADPNDVARGLRADRDALRARLARG